MTQPEYENKKRECWEEYCQTHPLCNTPVMRLNFDWTFDRAYALGKLQASCGQVKEAISQDEIEKASVEYADKIAKQYEVCNSEFVQEIMVAFERGANFTLGKQEKDAGVVIHGWAARDQDGYISLFKDKPTRDTCDKDDIPYGFWDEANSNHLELPTTSFPDLTWESEPQEVEIIIKRKKK